MLIACQVHHQLHQRAVAAVVLVGDNTVYVFEATPPSQPVEGTEEADGQEGAEGLQLQLGKTDSASQDCADDREVEALLLHPDETEPTSPLVLEGGEGGEPLPSDSDSSDDSDPSEDTSDSSEDVSTDVKSSHSDPTNEDPTDLDPSTSKTVAPQKERASMDVAGPFFMYPQEGQEAFTPEMLARITINAAGAKLNQALSPLIVRSNLGLRESR